MKKRAVALAVLALSSSAFAVVPDLTGRHFLNPGIGSFYGDNHDNETANILSAGYYFNPFFGARLNAASLGDSKNFFTVDGLVNVPVNLPVMPYLAVGLGTEKIDRSSFAADFGGGVRYFVNQNAGVTLDYRVLAQLSHSSNKDQIVSVGFIWAFGDAKPAATSGLAPAAGYQAQQLTDDQKAAVAQAKQTLKYVLPQGVNQCGENGATPQDGCITIDGNQVTMHLDVKFKRNHAEIANRYNSSINRLATFMTTYPTTQATLFGYASSEGPVNFNKQLSQKRADQVQSYLVNKQQIAAGRLSAMGMGTQDPVAANDNEAGRRQNRRVEAAVTVPMQVQS